jgi:multidrug resistance efflux pump
MGVSKPLFDPNLFRPAAIEHYMVRQQDGVPVPMRIAPTWTWWIFWSLFAVIAFALALSVATRIEVRGSGRGVFYIASGARPIVAQASGKVSQIAVARGQQVSPGDLLVELESATLQAQLLEAERAIEQYYETTKPAQDALDRLAESQLNESIRKHEIQKEQLASIEQSVKLYESKLKSAEEMHSHGLLSLFSLEEAKESLAQALRNVNSAKHALMSSDQEISSAKARIASDKLRNQQEIQNLITKRDALAYSIALTRIAATDSGILEGLHVHAGDVINPGQVLGRIIPGSTDPVAFALLPETDRAQVKPGDTVRLEVDQFPKADWGTINATIHRIPDSPATINELRGIFGDSITAETSSYLVELRIPANQNAKAAKQSMQSGMGFQANFVLKRQRPIVFMLEPLRRWLE